MTRLGAMFMGLLPVLACAAFVGAGADRVAPSPSPRSATNSAVELQGRLARVPGGMGFRADAGQLYTLVSNQLSAALFIDTNLQSKLLLLKGRVTPASRFEVTGNLHSMRDGRLHELYYFCEICSIKGVEPGPCMCCREPVQLVEEPVGRGDH